MCSIYNGKTGSKNDNTDPLLSQGNKLDSGVVRNNQNLGLIARELAPIKQLTNKISSDYNSSLKAKSLAILDIPVNDSSKQVAQFDGRNMTIFDDGRIVRVFGGVSGKDGFQDKKFQELKFKGPIPEGTYIARKERYQEHKDSSLFDKTIGRVSKHGAWPNGEPAWGNQRVWLDPAVNTDTKGRSGFTIHGGWVRGSAGCIDLTTNMPDFADWYKNNGKDLAVVVKYKK